MIDNVAAMVARAAAGDLTPTHGPRLTAAVEAAIQANGGRGKQKTPDQYIDPIAVGALIVAIAQFGYQVYTDRKKRGQNPTREGIAQAIRIERRKRSELTGEEIEIIEIISAKLIEQADDQLREPESGPCLGLNSRVWTPDYPAVHPRQRTPLRDKLLCTSRLSASFVLLIRHGACQMQHLRYHVGERDSGADLVVGCLPRSGSTGVRSARLPEPTAAQSQRPDMHPD